MERKAGKTWIMIALLLMSMVLMANMSIGKTSKTVQTSNSISTSSAEQPLWNSPSTTPKWHWGSNINYPGYTNVMATPIVAPLYDDNTDGVIDELDNTYVVFACFQSPSAYTRHDTICVVDGQTGIDVPTSSGGSDTYFLPPNPTGAAAVSAIGQIAVADVSGLSTGSPDGRPDILAVLSDGSGIICFDRHGGIPIWSTTVSVGAGSAIAVADLDADGIPEVIVGNVVLEGSNGVVLWNGSTGGNGVYHSVVDDLNNDGYPEVIAGNTAYVGGSGALFWTTIPTGLPDGYDAVADFIGEGWGGSVLPPPLRPEVVVVWPGNDGSGWQGHVYLLDDVETTTPVIRAQANIPGGDVAYPGKNGGPPTIMDFDGDGGPEIGVAGYENYTVFKWTGSGLSIIATFPITDHSSGCCSSSAFDFDGDHRDEIVYRDEQNLYVFGLSGTTPSVLWSTSCSSFTANELPTIVDVDRDYHAEIVVSADNSIGGAEWGIYVYENDEYWGRTRCIWNEHAYHITNIESDASVPQHENNNWEYFNNYRCQPSQGMGNCLVAAGSEDTNVYVFNFNGALQWSRTTFYPVVSVAMDNDAKFIATGSRGAGPSGWLSLFDCYGAPQWGKNLPISKSYDGFPDGTESKSVDVKYNDGNGGVVVAAATDNGLYLYNQQGNLIFEFPHQQTIVRISQDGNAIVSADYNTGCVYYFSDMHDGVGGWGSGDGTPEWIWPTLFPHYWAFWVAISKHGEYVAASTWYPDAVMLFQGWDGQCVWPLFQGWIGGYDKELGIRVDMPCDWGTRVVSVIDDGTNSQGPELLVWDHTHNGPNGWQPADGTPNWNYVPSGSGVTEDFYSVAISGSGEIAAAGGSVGTGTKYVFICNVDPSSPYGLVRQVQLGTNSIQSIDLTFTGKHGVAGDYGGHVWFFSKQSNTPLWSYSTTTPAAIHCVAISKSELCFMPYPPKRASRWPYQEMMVGCLESSGDYSVLGYRASTPLPAPTWQTVDAWGIHNVTGNRARASPCFGDLDSDGDYDMLISNAINVPAMGYKNIGNNTNPVWQRCTAWDVPSLGGYEQNPALADVDGDGLLDLCVGNELDHSARFFENTGNSSFPVWTRKPEWDITLAGIAIWPSPTFADLDGDGDYDLLFGSYDESYCATFENTGNMTNPVWTRRTEWDLTGLPTLQHKKPALVDLDNDGDYDLMVGMGNFTDPTKSKIWAYENTGNATSPVWTREPTWDIPLPGMTWIRPAFANLDGVHDIAVFNLASKIVAGQGYSIGVNATVINRGDRKETFNVTVYANEKTIQTVTISLYPLDSATITFTWNTTGFAKGNYTISAYAWPVPGETGTSDNTLTDGIVYVSIPGDINADKKVDVKDVYAVGRDFGTSIEGPNPPGRTYHPNCDINDDGKVDIKDYYTVCRHYGETDP